MSRLRSSSGSGSPDRCVAGDRCTTIRQKAYGTQVVVCYAWHPWHGSTARVERTVRKQSLAVLRVLCNRDQPAALYEIPVWLVDRADCALMTASEKGHTAVVKELLAAAQVQAAASSQAQAQAEARCSAAQAEAKEAAVTATKALSALLID